MESRLGRAAGRRAGPAAGTPGRQHGRQRAAARRRRRTARRPARRRDARRGGDARQQRDARLLPRPGGDRRGRSPAAGSTPATWRSCTRTATSSCATASRTSSSPAARTSPRSRSSRRSIAHPAISEAAVVGASRRADGARFRSRSSRTTGPTPELELGERAGVPRVTGSRGSRSRRTITVVDELPKTATGKIQKFVLREQVRAVEPMASALRRSRPASTSGAASCRVARQPAHRSRGRASRRPRRGRRCPGRSRPA